MPAGLLITVPDPAPFATIVTRTEDAKQSELENPNAPRRKTESVQTNFSFIAWITPEKYFDALRFLFGWLAHQTCANPTDS